MPSRERPHETAETMAQKQREISVSEFFLKNRHLLGFDNPRKALLTTVKEAVDNSLDACEEAGVIPEISVDIRQVAENRFVVAITDNGPGIVRAQIPKIFAKLLYGSKFHRLRMSRGQQGIGISAAVMYGQLTTGRSTTILSRVKGTKQGHAMDVQIDTRRNTPTVLRDEAVDWRPEFPSAGADGKPGELLAYGHGTCVAIEMEATYVRGRLSVDEYIKQCSIVNPHLTLHHRVTLLPRERSRGSEAGEGAADAPAGAAGGEGDVPPVWQTSRRAIDVLPAAPREIKPHPHGVELGLLMQMLRDTPARTLRAFLSQDFSRVGGNAALEICEKAGLNPKAYPTRIAHQESERLFKAINETKLMRPPTDCLSPIGEEAIVAGLQKEIGADFYTAVTRAPTVYRGNPFLVEVGVAYARPGEDSEVGSEEPVRVMRFANRVPLLYMGGGCAINKAIVATNWKTYGLQQPKGAVPLGPLVILVHVASVWVPFTSESKEAVAHYPEIIREITFALQECGRRLSVFLHKRRRLAEMERKRSFIALYIPHLALGLKQILDLSDREEKTIVDRLNAMLERTHLAT